MEKTVDVDGLEVWRSDQYLVVKLDGEDVGDMRVMLSDVRLAGHCVSGAMKWLEGYGLDYRTFIREGEYAAVLLATGDAYAITTVRKKRDRENGR